MLAIIGTSHIGMEAGAWKRLQHAWGPTAYLRIAQRGTARASYGYGGDKPKPNTMALMTSGFGRRAGAAHRGVRALVAVEV